MPQGRGQRPDSRWGARPAPSRGGNGLLNLKNGDRAAPSRGGKGPSHPETGDRAALPSRVGRLFFGRRFAVVIFRRLSAGLVFNGEGDGSLKQVAVDGNFQFPALERRQIFRDGEAQAAALGGPGNVSADKTLRQLFRADI